MGAASAAGDVLVGKIVVGVGGASVGAAVGGISVALGADVGGGTHDIVSVGAIHTTQLGPARFIVMAGIAEVARVRSTLERCATERDESAWTLLEIAAGIPRIVRETQEQYVPQMLNLDALGGVTYTKGCYPGQEIVARTRYLGRLKQRMYRIHVPAGTAPHVGDRLYSGRFGADQASGAMLYAAPTARGGFDALAVIQTSAAQPGELHWKSIDGAVVQLKDLPYSLPD